MQYDVSSGQVSSGIVLNTDSMYVYNGGTASSTTVNSGGIMSVLPNGTANNTTINANGHMEVTGGTATQITLNSAGLLWINSGGVVNSATVLQGANLWFDSSAQLNFFTLENGVSQKLSDGMAMTSATIQSGAIMDVANGGSAAAAKVNFGGTLKVSANGYAAQIVENGGYVEIDDNAVASFAANTFSGLTVGGKSVTVHSGTTAVNTVLNNAGEMEVFSGGTVNGTTINAGGMLWIDSGAVVNNTTLNSGCSMWIDNGKVINNTTIEAGAYLDITTGGTASGLTIKSGAVVHFENDAILNFNLVGRTSADPVLVNNFSLVSGNPTVTISVSNSQAEGIYALANEAAGFNKTVTICNQNVCGSLTVGGTVNLSGQDYTLMLASGTLTLAVGSAPAPVGVAGDLNADGRADVIMTITEPGHGAEGATGAWLIQGDQTAAWGNLSQRNPGWEIFGTGKTAAGKSTNDVYIRSTGNIIGAWTTNNTGNVDGWETIGEFDANTQIVGLGDFNGNGQTDLLLRNVNGAVGCFFTGGTKTGWNYFQSLGDEWKLTAVGDLNGDGRDDVVLKHDAGFAGSWLTQADGTMAWADLDTLNEGFSIVGAGDFNGDGTDDVLLKSGNYYGAWLVQNGNAVGWMGLGDLGGVTVEQIADFNGDGKADLRIRTTAGDLGTQLVLGEDNLSWQYYGSVGSEWSTALAAL